MSNHLPEFHEELCALVIFRHILNDPTIQKLKTLLSILQKEHFEKAEAIGAYADFSAALFEQEGNLSDRLLTLVLEDENFYMLARAQQKPILPQWEEALFQELTALQHISRIDPKELQQRIGYAGFLPCWQTAEYDFYALYQKRMEQIPINGYGIFAKYRAFILKNGALAPVKYPDTICMAELSGYERERGLVMENTLALLSGKPAANTLLYGDAGTGKSSTVKAVANACSDRGLRLIELGKEQLHEIPALLDSLSRNPLKFILFIDDLSFSSDDSDFAALKAILEGSISAKTSNIAIYVTSNRRHLIKESFRDRQGDDIHASDTREELLSLSDRFGLTVTFSKPDKAHYDQIVLSLADYYGVEVEKDELLTKAGAFALRKSGYSPRTAKQFIESLRAAQGLRA